VAEASEDEATKWRGGDLGFFASSRMPPEFFAAVTNLPVGGLSKPVRSHIGFHIVQLTAIEPARVIPFEEARGEIIGSLQNEQRRMFTGELTAQLSRDGEYFGVAR
jgi:parvulin-like peptidyl-prolyl isomerase